VTENFKDAPTSINEARATKEDDCRHLTPRDVLIAILRRIDAGELNPTQLAVVYAVEEARNTLTAIRRTGAVTETVGMLEIAKFDLMESSEIS
jgi:hypothetical protein